MIRQCRPLLFASLVTIAFSPNFASAKDLSTKIVGGEDAVKGEFPFIVSLQGNSGHFCGGSLIKKDWVLTAAHCVANGVPSKIVIGLHDRRDTEGSEIFRPSQVITHPRNDSENMDFDFALIRLDGISKYEPVSLNAEEIRSETDFVTAGWGATRSGGYTLPNILQKVTVPFVSDEICAKAYPDQTTSSMICAGLAKGGKDSCQGDSGGPLISGSGSSRKLVGVVSWGEGCALPDKYGVYGKVSAAVDWIEATAK